VKLKLKDLWENAHYETEEEELSGVPALGQQVALRLMKSTTPAILCGFPKRFRSVKTETGFNRVLEDFYDMCDEHLICVD
jgi:hypothetical protein